MLTFTIIHNDKDIFTAVADSYDEVVACKSNTKDGALEDVIFPIRAGNKPSRTRLLSYIAHTAFFSSMRGVGHTQATLHISSKKVPQGIQMSCRTCLSMP